MLEPQRSHVGRAQVARQQNPYEGRWNWWYSSIADIMIRDPGTSIGAIAAELNKHANTISMIVNTDMFQEYLARRKEAWRKEHDFALVSRLTKVAELSLDSAVSFLEKKKDQIPLQVSVEAMNSALDRLGYGPKPAAAVNVQVNNDSSTKQTVVVQGVSASALEEARAALRRSEQKRAIDFDARPSSVATIDPAPLGGASDNTSNPSPYEVNGDQGILDLVPNKE